MGMFADFALMIYLLFMHNNRDPPLGGLVNEIFTSQITNLVNYSGMSHSFKSVSNGMC